MDGQTPDKKKAERENGTTARKCIVKLLSILMILITITKTTRRKLIQMIRTIKIKPIIIILTIILKNRSNNRTTKPTPQLNNKAL